MSAMFYRRRQELQQLAEAEASGADFWSPNFPEPTRVRITYAMSDACRGDHAGELFRRARESLLRDEGWATLVAGNTIYSDFSAFVRVAEDPYVPSAIEAVHSAGRSLNEYVFSIGGRHAAFNVEGFTAQLNEILARDRISFELIDGRMVPFESRELHVHVVEPVLRLLQGSTDLAASESAYNDALAELSKGQPDNAITDERCRRPSSRSAPKGMPLGLCWRTQKSATCSPVTTNCWRTGSASSSTG